MEHKMVFIFELDNNSLWFLFQKDYAHIQLEIELHWALF